MVMFGSQTTVFVVWALFDKYVTDRLLQRNIKYDQKNCAEVVSFEKKKSLFQRPFEYWIRHRLVGRRDHVVYEGISHLLVFTRYVVALNRDDSII